MPNHIIFNERPECQDRVISFLQKMGYEFILWTCRECEDLDDAVAWLEEQGITVEPVPYREISQMGGLLRCSTLPLVRE